jgi:hypothetical protein
MTLTNPPFDFRQKCLFEKWTVLSIQNKKFRCSADQIKNEQGYLFLSFYTDNSIKDFMEAYPKTNI